MTTSGRCNFGWTTWLAIFIVTKGITAIPATRRKATTRLWWLASASASFRTSIRLPGRIVLGLRVAAHVGIGVHPLSIALLAVGGHEAPGDWIVIACVVIV